MEEWKVIIIHSPIGQDLRMMEGLGHIQASLPFLWSAAHLATLGLGLQPLCDQGMDVPGKRQSLPAHK